MKKKSRQLSLLLLGLGVSYAIGAQTLQVKVTAAAKPMPQAALSLWQASSQKPKKLAQYTTDAKGRVTINCFKALLSHN